MGGELGFAFRRSWSNSLFCVCRFRPMPDKYVEWYGSNLEARTPSAVSRPLDCRPAKRKPPQSEEDKAQKKKGVPSSLSPCPTLERDPTVSLTSNISPSISRNHREPTPDNGKKNVEKMSRNGQKLVEIGYTSTQNRAPKVRNRQGGWGCVRVEGGGAGSTSDPHAPPPPSWISALFIKTLDRVIERKFFGMREGRLGLQG